jgi:two-component system alkaline phosphatase synthesis response regulator PhoP
MGGDRRKILVADNEAHLLRALKLVLEEAGYAVITATDGEEAFHKTKEEKPDLLLLDSDMPRMNGDEVYRKLQADPLQRRIPVIMFTASNHADQDLKRPRAYPFESITKPFSLYSIVDKVEEVLRSVSNIGSCSGQP